MEYGQANQALGVPLVPKQTMCQKCHGNLLLRSDRPCRMTLYTESFVLPTSTSIIERAATSCSFMVTTSAAMVVCNTVTTGCYCNTSFHPRRQGLKCQC